jgi:hypothetical protein
VSSKNPREVADVPFQAVCRDESIDVGGALMLMELLLVVKREDGAMHMQ